MLTPEDCTRCLEMFRRFAAGGYDLDFVALTWLFKHEEIAEEFMMEHFELLTPAERISIYTFLYGMFRKSFRRLMESLLQAERDTACREELLRVRERYIDAFQRPDYRPSRAERLLECEKGLHNESPLLRCLAAMDVYDLTRENERVIPVLLAILRNRSGEARDLAAATLGEMRSLNQEAIQVLRAIAADTNDPARTAAEMALNAHKSWRRVLRWLPRALNVRV